MRFFADVAVDSLNKYGEELCGDKVEVVRTENSTIVVLADGLGSGVKANILATLTTKIAATMLREGADIYETVDTIVKTLPVCQVRQLAYSTFAIVKILDNREVYIAEYDNPPIFFYRNGVYEDLPRKELTISGKTIQESSFKLKENDTLVLVSDGVIHAGVGGFMNLGWQWPQVKGFLDKRIGKKSAKLISKDLVEACSCLYMDKPGDDTTVTTIKIRKPETVNLFTGPPEDCRVDGWLVHELVESDGKRVICGGTAANIVSRELKEEILVDYDTLSPEIPPIGSLKGFELVTEGVLTLRRTVEILKGFLDGKDNQILKLKDNNGAAKLAGLLMEDCTNLTLWVGKAINPAHQNPDLPIDLSIKMQEVERLADVMRQLGKEVSFKYI